MWVYLTQTSLYIGDLDIYIYTYIVNLFLHFCFGIEIGAIS